MLFEVEGVECRDCGGKVGKETEEKASGWRVYAVCMDCRHDFGRLGYLSRSDIDHIDEMHEQATELIKSRLG